jgi:hypothetical protein
MTSTIRRVLLALLIAVGAITPAVVTSFPVSADPVVLYGSATDADSCVGYIGGIYLPLLTSRVCFDPTTPYGPEIFVYNNNNWYTYHHVSHDLANVFVYPSLSNDEYFFTQNAPPFSGEVINAGVAFIVTDQSYCNPNDGINWSVICVSQAQYAIFRELTFDDSVEFVRVR